MSRTSAGSSGGGEGAGAAGDLRRSKLAATGAALNGERHKIFGVKKNPRFAASARLGLKPPKGTFEFVTAETYKGGWTDNKRGGFGTLTQANGNKYEGEWSNGLRHGHGTQWASRGGALVKEYTGWWVANRREVRAHNARVGLRACMRVCVRACGRARTRGVVARAGERRVLL